ncbi:hypothetical protein KC851_04085 [Candidatus Kaiserbacteria bacterium]|nr:hypothetical protein [Candidatus Kaiserbacteria bacterium]
MARISKQKLNDKVAKEIWQQLKETVGRLSGDQSGPFLEGLLGKNEQIMLAKRLAAIVLIHEGHSDYAIAHTLKISSATAGKLRANYQSEQYKKVISGIKKNKADYAAFVDDLIDIIHLGLPRYAGPGRWKLLNKK